MNSSKKKNLILVIAIICFGFMLTGGTYAYLTFGATVINSVYNTDTSCFFLEYTDDGVITGTLLQSSTPNVGLSGSVSIKTNEDCSVPNPRATIKLNVNDSTSDILLSDGALKYAVYANSSTVAVSTGVINTTGDITLYEDFWVSSNEKTYTVYVWLDGNIADSRYINLTFSGYIYATATQTEMLEESGLYDSEIGFVSWQELIDIGVITVSGTTLVSVNPIVPGELIIDDSITVIGDSAFVDCVDLTSVVIPSTTTVISNRAFFGCSRLTNIVVENELQTIGTSAFEGCENLTDIYYGGVNIPSNIGSGNDIIYNAVIHFN